MAYIIKRLTLKKSNWLIFTYETVQNYLNVWRMKATETNKKLYKYLLYILLY